MPDGIEVTWTTSTPDPGRYSIELTDKFGSGRYGELSLFFVSGVVAEGLGQDFLATVHYVGREDEYLDRVPVIVGNSVTMVFPRSAIERGAGRPPFYWRGAIGAHVDGEDRDDWCPDPPPGEDIPEPVELPQSTPKT